MPLSRNTDMEEEKRRKRRRRGRRRRRYEPVSRAEIRGEKKRREGKKRRIIAERAFKRCAKEEDRKRVWCIGSSLR